MALFLPPSPDSLVEEEDFTPPPVESFVSEGPTPLVPPVVRDSEPGSLESHHLVPAVRKIGGELAIGELGDTHPDIINRDGIPAVDIDQRGFFAPPGVFLDRESAAQATQLPTDMEPGRLHSTDLINSQDQGFFKAPQPQIDLSQFQPPENIPPATVAPAMSVAPMGFVPPPSMIAPSATRTLTDEEIAKAASEMSPVPTVPSIKESPPSAGERIPTRAGMAMVGGLAPIPSALTSQPPASDAEVAAGRQAVNLALSIPKFATSLQGVVAAYTGAFAPLATTAYFTFDTLKNVGKEIIDTYKNWGTMTPDERVVALEEIGGGAALGTILGRHLKGQVKKRFGAKSAEPTPAKESRPTEVQDYSSKDLTQYQDLKEKLASFPDDQVNGPEYMDTWSKFEELRNKYNGNPPAQLVSPEPALAGIRAESIPEPPTGDRLVTIQRPDGTKYVASFGDKFWDFGELGKRESIAKPTEEGKWSHGMIAKGETLIDDGGESALAGKKGFVRRITKPMETEAISDHLEKTHGIARDNKMVEIVDHPESDELGRYNPQTGKVEINRARISDTKDIDWVWDHERAHLADIENPGAVANLRKTITGTEWNKIQKEVTDAGYEANVHLRERDARVVTTLADAWRGRSWFNRLVKTIQSWASKKGIEMERVAAERAAVRMLAESSKSLKSPKWQPKTSTEKPLSEKTEAEGKWIPVGGPSTVLFGTNAWTKTVPTGTFRIHRLAGPNAGKFAVNFISNEGAKQHIGVFRNITEAKKSSVLTKPVTEQPLMGKKVQEEPETMGVRQSTREDMAKRGEPVVSVRGEGTNLKQALIQGREILGRDPAAAERALEEFNSTGRLSERDFNVSRAKYEQVMTEGRKIEKQFGTDSPEYHAARMEAARWSDVTKRMQTEWHRLGMGQQGETDIDTGSVLDMETKHKADTGKDFTPQQRKRATVVAGKVDAANTAANTAREALYNETSKGKSLSKAEKDALDAASKTVREAAIRMAEAQNKARVIQAGRAREVADLQVKAAKRALDAATKRAKEAAVKSARAEQKALADPARALWEKAKEYIDQGMDNFDDIRNKLATDLGMSVNKVTKLMTQTKRAKFLADDMWRKQQIARRMHMQAKIWLNSLEIPVYNKLLAGVPRGMFTAKVLGHGTVAMGTHAPMVAFQPRFWKVYAQNFFRMYKLAGRPTPKGQRSAAAYYEQQVNDLQRRSNYITAQRAGLANDPFVYEEYAMGPIVGKFSEITPQLASFLNKATDMGNRGYSVLKILRQDMFDQMWNKLPKTSQIPEMAEALADQINHATGVVKGRAPRGTNIAFFAPRLEASRVMWLVGDPIRAANIMLNWKNSNIGERAFAMNQIKEKLWVAGTMFTGLALNQGFLSATDSEQKINGIPESLGGGGFDPMRSDFLKFKAAGLNMAYGNAMTAMARLPIRLFVGVANEGKINKMVYDDETTASTLFDYARSQLSPFAGTVTDLALGRDFQERVLPRAGFGLVEGKTRMPKRLAARGITEGYTWPEYWTLQLSPIPFQEALKEVWGKGLGMTPEQMAQEYKAFATLMIMMGTGGRVSEDIPYQTRIPRTFKEAIEQQQ